MRKLFLASFKAKGEEVQQRLVVLNLQKYEHLTIDEQSIMALTKVETWFNHSFPDKELAMAAVYPAIGDGMQSSKKEIVEHHRTLIENRDAYISQLESKPSDQLLFTNWYAAAEIPERDTNEEDLSVYVLIDTDGYRKRFTVGYFDLNIKKWIFSGYPDKEPDMDHMKWTNLPLNKE